MITTIVWDMGGIFQRYFTEVMVDVGKDRGWPLERMPLGPTGVVPDPAYLEMSEGRLDEPDYLRMKMALLSDEDIDFDPVAEPDWQAERRKEVWELIHEVSDSALTQGILTNDATRWLGKNWWETWPDRALFDAIVDVATMPQRKPAPEPYLKAMESLAVTPAESIFVDDMPVNCRAAEAVGMSSHWFDITAPDASVNELRKRIGMA